MSKTNGNSQELDLGESFFEDLLSSGALEKQTDVPVSVKGTSNLRRTFHVSQLYGKRFDTKGWKPEMVQKLEHNIRAGYDAFSKKSQDLLKSYYQKKINAGMPGFADKDIEEINIPSADEVRSSFDLRTVTYQDDDGETITASVEVIWIKPVIEALSGFWKKLLLDAGAPLTRTVKGKGGKKDKEISTTPEYRLLRSKMFEAIEEADKIGKNGMTIRFVIPDGGSYTGFCDIWLGKQLIPANSFIKRRSRRVSYMANDELGIKEAEYDQPIHTVFWPFDYPGRTNNYTRYARWSSSWIQICFDYRGMEEIDGEMVPAWDVIADGQKVVFVDNENTGKKRPQTVPFFARKKGENDKVRAPSKHHGNPVDLISWIFGGEVVAEVGGQERVVQNSGEQIVFDLGFIADFWQVYDILEQKNLNEIILERRERIPTDDDGEFETLGNIVQKDDPEVAKADTADEEEADIPPDEEPIAVGTSDSDEIDDTEDEKVVV